jgi:hypothetical protein
MTAGSVSDGLECDELDLVTWSAAFLSWCASVRKAEYVLEMVKGSNSSSAGVLLDLEEKDDDELAVLLSFCSALVIAAAVSYLPYTLLGYPQII